MQHPFSIDLEDWYHGIELSLDEWGSKERRLEKGMDEIIELLDSTNTKCTFFTLGWIGKKYPALLRKLVAEGHEMASHGYNHEKVYDLSPEAFKEDISRTKKVLEDVTGQEVIGHRSPFFSITKDSLWALDILKECGFEYDCSISPIKTWRYGIANCPETIFKIKENGLVEFPVNTFSFFGKKLGIGGAYFRIFPYYFFNSAYKENSKNDKPTMFYAHPWEYDPYHPNVDMEFKAKLTHYFNLKGMSGRTRKLLQQYQFGTVANILQQESRKYDFEEVSIDVLKAG